MSEDPSKQEEKRGPMHFECIHHEAYTGHNPEGLLQDMGPKGLGKAAKEARGRVRTNECGHRKHQQGRRESDYRDSSDDGHGEWVLQSVVRVP